jgi:ligand-binding sensor domain-containing protein
MSTQHNESAPVRPSKNLDSIFDRRVVLLPTVKSSPPLGLLFVLLVSSAAVASENVPEYSTRIWQSDQGLPLDAVHSVAQTPDGFMWVGTEAGLARFDGTQFAIFDSKNVPGMTNAEISGLRTTHDGSLWIATRGAGLYRLKDGQFSRFSTANGLASDYCPGSLFEDDRGTLWVATLAGVSHYSDGAFKTVSSAVVRQICQDLHRNLWLATSEGIDCWSNGAFVLHLGPDSEPNVRAICCGPDGTVWFGAGNEVSRIDHGQCRPFLKGDVPKYNLITVLYFDRRGTFWAGTYGGLFRIINGRFVPELSPGGLPYGTITEIFEDREGDLWVCAKDGLIRLKPNRVLCYTEQQGLGNDNVSSVLEDEAGEICVGTWGGGINLLKDGVITTYTNKSAYPVLVLGLYQDRARHIWAGTDFNQGVFDLDGEHVRRYMTRKGGEIPPVRVIFEDHASNMWLGTSRGLFQVRPNGLQLFGQKDGLATDVIRAIVEDEAENLWIGTQAGLVRERNGIFKRFTTSNGLGHDYVLTIFEDKEHSLWLGTLGGGLVRYRDGKFTAYTTRDGLFSDNIGAILEDDHRWLWIGSERGIFRLSLDQLASFDRGVVTSLRSVPYGKTDGMVNKVCNHVAQPSAWKSHDGRLWFATIKGLCVIDPNKKILPEAPPPPIVIEELHTEQQTITSPQESAGPIRLSPGRGELEFRYAALAFRAPEENRYQYQLEGIDSQWVNADGRQIAHYNNIYPGHYTFRVIACNSDGVWNTAGAAVDVLMLPHFWQTWWFKPALLALAVASLLVVYKVVLNRRLEIDRLRVRIAADLHDEIGSNLASISLLSQLGQKTQTNGACPELAEINRIALFTANGIREIVWFINPDYDTTGEMVARMKEVAAQMLLGINYKFESPASQGGRKLSPEFRRNVFLIFKEIMHNIVKHSQARSVEITLWEAQGKLRLRVADDGRGFDAAAVTRGNGLRNIRLRTGNLGGTVEIGRGTAAGAVVDVSVRIP